MLGRELEDLFPVAFLPENQSLAIAIMSYNGRMDFGLLGDYDAMPDIEELGDALRESLAELVDAAGGKPRASGAGRGPRRLAYGRGRVPTIRAGVKTTPSTPRVESLSLSSPVRAVAGEDADQTKLPRL